ncbi:vasopressin V1a receptor-like isoform X2 [Macrobrachium nipponense]|uniref:vasopressin V1a receptor-like isoform X2 n=1 Tax=Macrobrachium nipponense TaxID=159736 RepID=UPI0030C83F4E
MYSGQMMSFSPLAANTTYLDAVLGGSDRRGLLDLPDHTSSDFDGQSPPQYLSTETQQQHQQQQQELLSDYQPMDLDDAAMLLNDTNGTNFTSYIPEGLKYINRTQLIAYSLLFPFAAVGNLVVFVALFRNRHRKSRVNMMIMHLSLADMIVTFVFLPTEITWHITIEWVFGNVGCKVYKFLSAFGFYMSSMVLVCISLDRYFAVLHPLKVNDAQRRGKIMLFFAWAISSVISLPQTVIFNVQLHPSIPDFYQCVTFGFFDSNNGGEMMYTVFCISFLYFIPLTIIIIAYTRIILEITRKSRDTKQDYSREERYHGRLHLRRSNMSNIERARTRTLRMTFIIVMAFIWCWTPYALGTLWNFIDPETFHSMNQQVQDILFIIAVSNSVVNPIIYGRYSISCCRGLWYKAGDFCCCCCFCCCPHQRRRMATDHPPNINSSKSNGHFNVASGNTRSTIYNNSARDKMVVGVRLQDPKSASQEPLSSSSGLSRDECTVITETVAGGKPATAPSLLDANIELKLFKEKENTLRVSNSSDAAETSCPNSKALDRKAGERKKSVEGIRLVVISCVDPTDKSPRRGRKKSTEGIVFLEPVKANKEGEEGEDQGALYKRGEMQRLEEVEDKESPEGDKGPDQPLDMSFCIEGYSQQEPPPRDGERPPATKRRQIKEVLEVQVTKDGDFVCRKLPELQK